jgi:hypothetical protein
VAATTTRASIGSGLHQSAKTLIAAADDPSAELATSGDEQGRNCIGPHCADRAAAAIPALRKAARVCPPSSVPTPWGFARNEARRRIPVNGSREGCERTRRWP